jgi:hypothetical protein
MPERWGTTAITWAAVNFANGTTLLSDVLISGGYSVPTVASQAACFAVTMYNFTTAGATSNPKGTLWFEVEAELGF